MTPAERQRHEQALDWARRIHDPQFSDWTGHADWLEADPLNPQAFDAASFLIEGAVEGLEPAPALAPAEPVNDNAALPSHRQSWRRWGTGLGLAAAASIAGIFAWPALQSGGAQPYSIATGPGEHRSVTLADGTQVALNGDSLIRLDKAAPRLVSMERGEAFFTVVHDAAHPFEVHAGGTVFRDVGTAFDVVRSTDGTELAVREGAVMVDPAGTALRLDGGQSIRIAAGGAVVRSANADAIGSWRQGRLEYRDASLSRIAADIARNIGQPVSVERALGQRRFSGVIMIDADRPRLFHRLSAILNVTIVREGSGWRMAAPAR